LDLSDIYLELNLSEEAHEIAHEGFSVRKLGMGYEAAKTLANEATLTANREKTVQALERFTRAREMFGARKSRLWPWLIDLFRAYCCSMKGAILKPGVCVLRRGLLRSISLAGKAVLAHLLLCAHCAAGGGFRRGAKATDESFAPFEHPSDTRARLSSSLAPGADRPSSQRYACSAPGLFGGQEVAGNSAQ